MSSFEKTRNTKRHLSICDSFVIEQRYEIVNLQTFSLGKQNETLYPLLARNSTFPIHEIHSPIWIFCWYGNKSLRKQISECKQMGNRWTDRRQTGHFFKKN